MHVELLTVPDCPNAELARRRIEEAARRVDVTVTVDHRVIDDADEAEQRGMHGSPTVLVDGVDAAPLPDDVGRLACRLAPDTPSVGDLAELLTHPAD